MSALKALGIAVFICGCSALSAGNIEPKFKVIAFFTAKQDDAHISFVREANQWFPKMAAKHNFTYDTTSNWRNLNSNFLAKYQVVVFLDTRPEEKAERAAFQRYMEQGGAWMGFHFAGFALTPSAYPANWDWYHNTFLGSGSYASNTWRPTSAILRVEDRSHPATHHLPDTFKSSPSEWYRWQNDLRRNPDIDILLSIDSTSFPLGTGPKQHEIWRSGYYPVVWTNRNYKMLYLNMGHNDIDYEHKYEATNKTLSYTLNNRIQDQLIIDGLLWLAGREKKAAVLRCKEFPPIALLSRASANEGSNQGRCLNHLTLASPDYDNAGQALPPRAPAGRVGAGRGRGTPQGSAREGKALRA